MVRDFIEVDILAADNAEAKATDADEDEVEEEDAGNEVTGVDDGCDKLEFANGEEELLLPIVDADERGVYIK
jgi:hypothetical protein